MLKRVVLACLMVSLMPTLAMAHGPTRQKVTTKIEINAPADKVWAVIGKFQDMNWTGYFTKTEGKGDNAPGATRTVTSAKGAINEQLLKFNEAEKSYAYEMKDVDVKVLPVNNFSASISVSGDASKSLIEWKTAFYRGYVQNDPPADLNEEAAIKAVKEMTEAALANLKKTLEAGG